MGLHMNKVFWIAGSAGAALLLSSCVTYPYDTAFNACEREANDCYRLCEEIPDEGGYVACQAHCDRDIDRCFDTAYAPYSGYGYGGYGGGGYGYGSPWYGRYGSWYPNNGYYMSFNYYDRYGYRRKKHPPQDYRPPSNNPPPAGPPPSGNARRIDRPRTPNRYYNRSSPPVSGPSQPNAGSSPPPRRSVSPPNTGPTYSPPPSGGSTPTYSPPPSQPPAGESSPRAPRREVGPGVSRGEPDRDQD